MADSLNTPTLSKLHQALSRRSLMREMGIAGSLVLVPVAAIAEPQNLTSTPTPQERLTALIEEIQMVVKEINPEIQIWKIHTNLDSKLPGCPFLIAAFPAHPNPRAEPHVSGGWFYSQGLKS